eukprot:gene24707-biopygen17934
MSLPECPKRAFLTYFRKNTNKYTWTWASGSPPAGGVFGLPRLVEGGMGGAVRGGGWSGISGFLGHIPARKSAPRAARPPPPGARPGRAEGADGTGELGFLRGKPPRFLVSARREGGTTTTPTPRPHPQHRTGRPALCHAPVQFSKLRSPLASQTLRTLGVSRDSRWKAALFPEGIRVICAPGARACGGSDPLDVGRTHFGPARDIVFQTRYGVPRSAHCVPTKGHVHFPGFLADAPDTGPGAGPAEG